MKEYYTLELDTDAAAELATTAVAKNWIKLPTTITTDDTLIDTLLKAARRCAERHCNRAFINQTWTMIIDGQPDLIELPMGRLVSVTSVKVVAEDGTKTTESADDDYHTQTGEHGRVWLREGATWTSTTRDYGQMEIIYIVGYGAASTNVPNDIIAAVKKIFLLMWKNRSMDIPVLTKDVIELLAPYKIHRI